MSTRVLGQPIARLEDERLLCGRGRYLDDVELPGALQAAFLRSPLAHARIARLDASAARAHPGVVAVYTAADLGPLDRPLPPVSEHEACFTQPPLARDEVRYAGQTVAMVVAESRYVAEDALELVEVEYEPLPVLVDLEQAAAAGSVAATVVQVVGDPARAFAEAEVVVRGRYAIERSAGMPLETRGVAARLDPGSGELTVWDSTQAPHAIRDGLAPILGLPLEQVRVVAPDTGGGFGTKVMLFYPEEVLVPWAAVQLGRPVKWVEDRLEHFVASTHERGQVHEVEAAATRDGVVLALRDSFLHDAGAFVPTIDVAVVTAAQLAGPYRIPNLRVEFRAVVTNTVPVTPYRGCGRPHACFVMERILDRLARELGLDRVEIRRRNFIEPQQFPYRRDGLVFADGLPVVLDSGDYARGLDLLLEAVGYEGFPEEQRAARAEGRHLGLGLACYVEGTGLGPYEGARVEVEPGTGRILVAAGVASQGQSHETTLAQVAAEALGVEPAGVAVTVGDTAAFPTGLGTYASRSAVVAGSAVAEAAGEVAEKALRLASERLEAAVSDLELEDGRVVVRGTRVGVSLGKLAAEDVLAATAEYRPPHATWASGAHAAVVEVDPETGQLRYLRYVAVHDCGTALNPLVVEGQVVGGVAQGIGGSFYERLAYDAQGQLRNASFMDFLVPYATEVPPIEVLHLETPSPLNPLGAKGAGEAGVIPVPALTASALDDALAPFGVEVEEMPLDPARLRALIEEAV